MIPSPMERDYTVKEAAEILEKSYVTVLKYIHSKKLRAVRRGGNWVIMESELNRFIQEGDYRTR